MNFNDLTRSTLKSLNKSAPKPKMFMSFFGNVENKNTTLIELDKKFKGIRVANFVNPDAVADGTEKLSFDAYQFQLPTMQDLVPLTGKELEKRLMGQDVYKQTTSSAKGAILIKEIQSEQKDMIESKMELMAIDAVFNGQITVIGKGENRVIAFNRSATHEVDLGSGNYWDETDGVPEDDIEDFIDIIGQAGSNATHIIGRFATMRVLAKKLKENDDFDSRRYDVGSLTFKDFSDISGARHYGSYKGLELWGFDGNYTDKDGTSQKAVPEKKIVVLSSVNGNVDVSGYAVDTDIDFSGLNASTKAVKDARNFISKISGAKKVIEVEAIQSRSPMLIDADSTLVATVIA